MTKKKIRYAGVLLHPTSLPSPYGIGDLGPEAYAFIDFLADAGQHLWQTLPLTPTGFGNSPYQSYSAFAGQTLLISPDDLLEKGLLCDQLLLSCPQGDPRKVDYDAITPWKMQLLREAYETFLHGDFPELKESYETFCKEEAHWLYDYALFMACKDLHEGADWLSWEEPYQNPTPAFKKKLYEELPAVDYYQFVQFLFYEEWSRLKEYANEKEVKLIGDMPIFVSLDSADVWANQHLFQLDSTGYPTVVAGVPPDYFSATGQLWGNPLYDWKTHKAEGYQWWIQRLRHQLRLSDYVRIDHFRGFEAYWEVPATEETAIHGKWIKGPGEALFAAFQKEFGTDIPIIAEDLGIITPEVEALRDTFHLPGMKILQFAFDGEDESTYLPHQLVTTNCICYTGTHDNNTTRGWYDHASEYSRDKVRRYMNTDGGRIHWDFIRTALGSIATFAIYPLQDVLGLGEEARMNTPGVADGNWDWRYEKQQLHHGLAEELMRTTKLYGR